jgi:hypothetical protein
MALTRSQRRARRTEILSTNRSIRRGRLGRRLIDWTKPPKATDMVFWLHGGKRYKMSFRTACAMARLNNLAKAKYGVEITVIQPCFNTTVAASAGTHDYDCCFDLYIPGVSWLEQQRFLRANGFACWYRHPPAFGYHIHGFVLPPQEGSSRSDDFKVHGFKVGLYVDGGYSTRGRLVSSSQIEDYYNHAFGLANAHTRGSDRSWFPSNIGRTIFNLDAFIARRVTDAMRAKKV